MTQIFTFSCFSALVFNYFEYGNSNDLPRFMKAAKEGKTLRTLRSTHRLPGAAVVLPRAHSAAEIEALSKGNLEIRVEHLRCRLIRR